MQEVRYVLGLEFCANSVGAERLAAYLVLQLYCGCADGVDGFRTEGWPGAVLAVAHR